MWISFFAFFDSVDGNFERELPPAEYARHQGEVLDFLFSNRSFQALPWLAWKMLSSPRAKRAGPKGLRAESARAFTGRRNSHSGRGQDFLTGQPDFFAETAVTPERKVDYASIGTSHL